MEKREEPEHNRTQFQIDRIAFFSDAVIAIAITLMVLEIKIPELGRNTTFHQVVGQYGETFLLHTIALLIGFWTIGILWIRHHELFEHIYNYNKRLVRVNLLFLLTIILLPISISFFFTPNEPSQLQQLFYFLNLFLCSLTYIIMLLVIFHRGNNFSMISDRKRIKKLKISSFLNVSIFFLVAIFVLFNSHWFYLPFLILPIARFVLRRYWASH